MGMRPRRLRSPGTTSYKYMLDLPKVVGGGGTDNYALYACSSCVIAQEKELGRGGGEVWE